GSSQQNDKSLSISTRFPDLSFEHLLVKEQQQSSSSSSHNHSNRYSSSSRSYKSSSDYTTNFMFDAKTEKFYDKSIGFVYDPKTKLFMHMRTGTLLYYAVEDDLEQSNKEELDNEQYWLKILKYGKYRLVNNREEFLKERRKEEQNWFEQKEREMKEDEDNKNIYKGGVQMEKEQENEKQEQKTPSSGTIKKNPNKLMIQLKSSQSGKMTQNQLNSSEIEKRIQFKGKEKEKEKEMTEEFQRWERAKNQINQSSINVSSILLPTQSSQQSSSSSQIDNINKNNQIQSDSTTNDKAMIIDHDPSHQHYTTTINASDQMTTIPIETQQNDSIIPSISIEYAEIPQPDLIIDTDKLLGPFDAPIIPAQFDWGRIARSALQFNKQKEQGKISGSGDWNNYSSSSSYEKKEDKRVAFVSEMIISLLKTMPQNQFGQQQSSSLQSSSYSSSSLQQQPTASLAELEQFLSKTCALCKMRFQTPAMFRVHRKRSLYHKHYLSQLYHQTLPGLSIKTAIANNDLSFSANSLSALLLANKQMLIQHIAQPQFNQYQTNISHQQLQNIQTTPIISQQQNYAIPKSPAQAQQQYITTPASVTLNSLSTLIQSQASNLQQDTSSSNLFPGINDQGTFKLRDRAAERRQAFGTSVPLPTSYAAIRRNKGSERRGQDDIWRKNDAYNTVDKIRQRFAADLAKQQERGSEFGSAAENDGSSVAKPNITSIDGRASFTV
ncbi:MAG: hypothetical protein EZS28_031161, partial [Streblomastix strix]